jgi:hypothetical protein
MGGMPVRRALPRRERRTVGPWCFADHMGPALATETAGQWRSEDPRFGRVDSPLPRLRLPPLPWPRTP